MTTKVLRQKCPPQKKKKKPFPQPVDKLRGWHANTVLGKVTETGGAAPAYQRHQIPQKESGIAADLRDSLICVTKCAREIFDYSHSKYEVKTHTPAEYYRILGRPSLDKGEFESKFKFTPTDREFIVTHFKRKYYPDHFPVDPATPDNTPKGDVSEPPAKKFKFTLKSFKERVGLKGPPAVIKDD